MSAHLVKSTYINHLDLHVLLLSWSQKCDLREGDFCLAKPWAIAAHGHESLLPEGVGNGFVCAKELD